MGHCNKMDSLVTVNSWFLKRTRADCMKRNLPGFVGSWLAKSS